MRALVLLLLLTLTLTAQETKAPLTFEVASVKPNTTNGPSDMRGPRRSGDFVSMHNTQLYSVIFYAYHLEANYQMVGFTPLPDGWQWFDIEARAGATATEDQVRLMFQSMLADRFKLKAHRETRELPQYELTAARNAKLTAARQGLWSLTIEGKTMNLQPGSCSTTLWREGNHIACHDVGIDQLRSQLAAILQAPVVNRTTLAGNYDLDILYLPEERRLAADAPPAASLPDAIQELGFKLVKGKGPVEVLVIDHLEKPTEN